MLIHIGLKGFPLSGLAPCCLFPGGYSQCSELLEFSRGQTECFHLKWHSAFEVLPFCFVCSSTASCPALCNCADQAGGVRSGVPLQHAAPRSRHPPPEGLPAGVIGEHETRIVLRAVNSTAVVIHVHFLHVGKKASVSAGNEKNVPVIVYNSTPPPTSFQSNVPSLVFYLPAF